MIKTHRHLRFFRAGMIVLLLWLSFGLMVSSMVRHSPTVDEQTHLFRGVAYLKTGATHFLWGHPLLASSINALPLLTEPELRLPVDSAAWQEGQPFVAAADFLWQQNESSQRLVFLSRLATVWLTLLLGSLLARWGREIAGYTAALPALALLLLDPNVLAHGRLITSDIAVTFFMTLAVYGYWRWISGRGRPIPALVLCGLGIGAAGIAKFSAAALLPILALIALITAVRRRSWQPFAGLLAAGGIAALVIAAVYTFRFQPLWEDIVWQLNYFSRPHGAYLLGRYSPTGWWYYFPIAFLVKTPLPALLLLPIALVTAGSDRLPGGGKSRSLLFLLLPAAVYFVVSLLTPLNIGYRHLLPALPFLYLFIAVVLSRAGKRRYGLLVALAAIMILSGALIWPNYISYFNSLAGGADGRWRILSDSNIDWGQDLPALAAWQQEHNRPLYLSYFGTAPPNAYGLDFDSLPTWSSGPEQLPPDRQPFNPADPAPGLYAISVTNLHGLVLGEGQNTFAWFRDKTPLARIGGSIFIYEVAARGEGVETAFSGLTPAELVPELHQQLDTNDVRVRWFNSQSSLIWPVNGGWLAAAADPQPPPALQELWPPQPAATAGPQFLYQVNGPPESGWMGSPTDLGGVVTFYGYRFTGSSDQPGEITLLTAWQIQQATERPLKIFIHALDQQGQIAGQWDGLDVEPLTWKPGDFFVQLHYFTVPEQFGPLQLTVGVYDGETLERLKAADGSDTIPLEAWHDPSED